MNATMTRPTMTAQQIVDRMLDLSCSFGWRDAEIAQRLMNAATKCNLAAMTHNSNAFRSRTHGEYVAAMAKGAEQRRIAGLFYDALELFQDTETEYDDDDKRAAWAERRWEGQTGR